jgi:hypothetical protein
MRVFNPCGVYAVINPAGQKNLITCAIGSFWNQVAGFLENHDSSRIVIYSRNDKKQRYMGQLLRLLSLAQTYRQAYCRG